MGQFYTFTCVTFPGMPLDDRASGIRSHHKSKELDNNFDIFIISADSGRK
jgi:hypothetical protein